jgi:uncharacterized membrane protein
VNSPINWPIRRCLILCSAITIAILILIGLASLGIDAPVLRQIIGFIFLAFVPGILILRILKIHNISWIESLAYSIGLSLTSSMFLVAFANFALTLMGIPKPISLLPVTVVLAAFTLIVMAIAYVRDKAYIDTTKIKWPARSQLAAILFLVFLLLLTILSITLIDDYQNNVLLILVLLAIAGVIALAAFGKFIQTGIYPLAVFVIGLCLLYQTSLLSPYLVGTDIYTEYHFYHLVASNGFWDSSVASPVNSCLSITMLAPIYSQIMNLDGVLILKAVYPLFFALVPLILFHIFSRQMSPKKAFLAAIFFMIVPTFSLELPALGRQQIAELFLVLVILLLIDRKIGWRPRLALLIIFSMSMVVAHYALGMIGFIYMGIALPLVFLIRSKFFRRAWGWLTRRFGGLPQSLTVPGALPAKGLIILIAVYFAFGITWYATIASGVDLNQLSVLWHNQAEAITSGFSRLTSIPVESNAFAQLGQRASLIQTALGLDFSQASIQGKVFRVFQYITELFLIVGFLRLVFKPGRLRFAVEYIALSTISAMLLAISLFVPYFAEPLNITRMYHIALITLAPFCILGGEAIWSGISWSWHKIWRSIKDFKGSEEDNETALRVIALAVLIPYFLFTSGFIYEVTGQRVTDKADTPYSIALSSYRLDLAGIFNLQDGAASRWLAQNTGDSAKVYVDSHTGKLLTFYDFSGKLELLPRDTGKLETDSYIYLSTWNTTQNELTYAGRAKPGIRQHVDIDDIPGLKTAIESKSIIYVNGGAEVFGP